MDKLRLASRGRGPAMLTLGLAIGLAMSGCGISKPSSAFGSGGASASGTGGAAAAGTGGAAGVAGAAGTGTGGATGTAGAGGAGGGATGTGAVTTGLQYNGVIRFLREVP